MNSSKATVLFCKNGVSKMFDRVLNTPQDLLECIEFGLDGDSK